MKSDQIRKISEEEAFEIEKRKVLGFLKLTEGQADKLSLMNFHREGCKSSRTKFSEVV